MTTAALFLPPTALSGLVFAGIARDTRGASLCHEDRFNHFPASPLIALNIVTHGETRIVTPDAAPTDVAALARVTLTGPQPTPITSWSPGAVTALSIGFYPDAFAKLTGLSPEALAGRTSPDIPAILAPLIQAVTDAADIDAGWQAGMIALSPIWAENSPLPARLTDWTRALGTRAALSGPGKSLRAAERRLKRWVGQSRQSLDHFARIDALHAEVVADTAESLADLAVASGFSDQSHMGRAVRRVTGFSPRDLNARIAQEEAFWCYRILGERF